MTDASMAAVACYAGVWTGAEPMCAGLGEIDQLLISSMSDRLFVHISRSPVSAQCGVGYCQCTLISSVSKSMNARLESMYAYFNGSNLNEPKFTPQNNYSLNIRRSA